MTWSRWIRTVEIEPAIDVGAPSCKPDQIEMHLLIRCVRAALPTTVAIQVERGVSPDTVRDLNRAGATLLVAKESIFDREDLPRAFRRLMQMTA
jgi:pentose-5-phosphate-3-epimerase